MPNAGADAGRHGDRATALLPMLVMDRTGI